MSRNAHQYFWKNDFSATSSAGVSLPSASTTGGLREFNLGTGPGVGGMSSTCTLAKSSGVAAGRAFAFDSALDLDLDFETRGAAGGTVAEIDALNIVASCGEMCKEMICVRELLNVAREVRVELPLGRSMRSNCGEVGSSVVDCESADGGVHDDSEDLRVLGL